MVLQYQNVIIIKKVVIYKKIKKKMEAIFPNSNVFFLLSIIRINIERFKI